MIVRELITRLGIDFDESGANKAEQKVSGLTKMLQTAAAVFAAGQVFGFFKDAVMLASAADQVYGKLNRNFGEYAQGVIDWSKSLADATGQSGDEIRQMTATFGSMLTPTLNFDRRLAADMSADMTELAINIAAIEDKNPADVADRLRSALTGSSEAVDQFGINLKDAALKEFALKQGIQKTVQQMTVAEKTQLIYNKIMSDTRDRTGAATAELKEQSGQTLRLRAAWHDFQVAIGRFVSGPALWLTRTLGDVLRVMEDVTTDTSKMGTALAMLGGIMLAIGIPIMLPFIKLAAALAAVYVVVEDLWTMFEGGDSLIGRFIDAVAGVGAQQKVVEAFRDVWKDIVGYFTSPEFHEGVRSFVIAIRDGARAAAGFGGDVWKFLHGEGTPGERRARAAALGNAPGVVNEPPQPRVPMPFAPPMSPVGAAGGAGGAGGGVNVTFNVTGRITQEELEASRRALDSVKNGGGWFDLHQTLNTTPPR